MDVSLNNYLKSIIPNFDYNKNPLEIVEVDYQKRKPYNYLANKILTDMSLLSFDNANHGDEFISKVFKLKTLIKAYDFIERSAVSKGVSDRTIKALKEKEFTQYQCSLKRIGLKVEQFQEMIDEFQRLSMHNIPKENVYEMQIGRMVTLVKVYLENNKINIDSRDAKGCTQLNIACKLREIEEIKILLSLGCDPNIPDFEGFTPFYNACNKGVTEVADILIKSGNIDPNIKCLGSSPLYLACYFGFAEIVSILVNSGRVDLNVGHEDTTPPMIAALAKGQEKCARILIEAGVDINKQDEFGETLFHKLVRGKNSKEAKMLLLLGCDPNIPDFQGFTPLYTACDKGMTEIVDILIKREDVDPNIKCSGSSPLYLACYFGFDEIVSILVNSKKVDLNDSCKDKTPFDITLVKEHEKCARILIEAGVDINKQDEFGDTLFHKLVKEKNSKEAKMLLLLGCDPNIPDFEGFTPFYTACNKGVTEIADILIKREDVDPNIKCKNCPPIFTACGNGFDEIVSIIVNSKKADLNAQYDRETPLIVAATNEHEKCVSILISAGVDINFRDEDGDTLFHFFVENKEVKKAKMMLSLGCDPNIPDLQGLTPFYTACRNKMTEIVDILIKREDVDPNIKWSGTSPLYQACYLGFDEIVSIIAKSGKANLNEKNKGSTALVLSLYRGFKECANILVENGAKLTIESNSGHNPLLLACEYGFEDTVAIIAKRMMTDINVNQLDLHNMAIIFEREKIKLKNNIVSRYKYSFEKLDSFLNGLSEKREHLFRKEVLDSFCSYIFVSLKEGSFQEFKKFLDYGKNFYENTTQYIIDYLMKRVHKSLIKVIERYKQILPIEIEKAGSLKKIDKLKLANLLEIEIPTIEQAAHKIFSRSKYNYPRTIIVEKGKKNILILARKRFSIIRGKGGFKDVRSAFLVPYDMSSKVERIVYAEIIKKTKKSAIQAHKEYSIIKEFSGLTAFGRVYKFFSFDKNGNYIRAKELDVREKEEEIRSAIVIEEMDGDFEKVVTQLTLSEQVSVTKQLVEALNIMMRKEKVSWDLKSYNILISKNINLGNIRAAITDLGYTVNIQQGVVKKSVVYGSPWYGAPELLYATDVVDDANKHLKCEMWALGLVLYRMCFKIKFPLIDTNFSNNYNKYRHLAVSEQVAYYQLSYEEYVRKLNDLVENPLKELMLLPKKVRTPSQNLEILIYRMLQLDSNVRITPADALEFCIEHF